MIGDRTTQDRRCGFTLMEMSIVCGLMVLLAILLSQTWSGLGRPTADMAARCHVSQEAKFAFMALTRDLGGSLGNQEGRLGSKTSFPLVGRLQPGNAELWLCFDGGSVPNGTPDWAPPDVVIIYEVQEGKLIRWDQNANTTFVVAHNVERLELQDLGDRVQIALTFTYRNVTQTYTMIARNP